MIMKKILSWLRNKRVSNEPAGIQYFIRTEETYTSREDAELAMAMLREGKIPLMLRMTLAEAQQDLDEYAANNVQNVHLRRRVI